MLRKRLRKCDVGNLATRRCSAWWVGPQDPEHHRYLAGEAIDVAAKGVSNTYGNTGDDTLIGDAGNNFLAGGAGSDRFDAGAGDDVLLIDAGGLLGACHSIATRHSPPV